MPNRLADESSPYLLQHKDNPVDWYPWGTEAFARARAEDKPVFVSIGYAACHWCHVMERESFEDPDVAALMNELFVNIKVDREERPDVDAVYMNAIHVIGEGGGWPLSAFCDPTGRPYFLGTYFPPEDRYGRPGFSKLLAAMARVYREERDKVAENAEAVLDGLRRMDEHFRRGAVAGAGAGALEPGLLIKTGRWLAQRSDPHQGGLGAKPKFPSSSAHELLGRAGRLRFGKPAREAWLLQCEKMARGGIYDHLGGGFARYSVDERWLVPHFEKMLYDNAQLVAIYGDAYAMTGEAEYARVVEDTVAWLEREMSDASGGLFSSLDADSEGREGAFYVWTPEEIEDAIGVADAIVFCRAYGVTPQGNFEGQSVLSRVLPRGGESEEAALADMRRRLLEARARRVRPATDTKVLSGWNGLAVTGLLRAWEATGYAPALALARRVAEFLANEMAAGGGERLVRVYGRDLDGTVEDYAFVAQAFLRMASATEDASWWDKGGKLLGAIRERFYEQRDGVGVFFMTAKDAGDELVYRPESHSDGAIPSGAAVAVECLLEVGRIGGDPEAVDIAERYLGGRAAQAAENPFAAARLLCAADLAIHGQEVVITDGEGRDALVAALRATYAPAALLAGPWASGEILAGKGPAADGRARAYVCRRETCAAPVTEPAELAQLLAAPAS